MQINKPATITPVDNKIKDRIAFFRDDLPATLKPASGQFVIDEPGLENPCSRNTGTSGTRKIMIDIPTCFGKSTLLITF